MRKVSLRNCDLLELFGPGRENLSIWQAIDLSRSVTKWQRLVLWRLILRTIDDYGTFEESVAKAGDSARELAFLLRKLVAEVMPNVVEVPWPRMRMASYGVGPKKKTEHFCYISAQKSDVNLGFYYGAELPDPNELLEGTGKLLRHVKIHEATAIRSPALRKLLTIASRHRMPAQASE
jgi:hypothetical protein